MLEKNIIIASHSLDEAITKAVMDNKESMGSNITIISLKELIADYQICDELSDSGHIIRWYKHSELCISNTDHFLLNRVLYVPNNLFNNFIKCDQEYAQREFEAYLGFAFNAFAGVGNQSPTGICGDLLSLPQQWNAMSKKFSLKIPRYYWGPRYKKSLTHKNNLVYSSIHNLLNWSPTYTIPEEEHIFCFEKPLGEPVFILSIGNEQLITSNIVLSVEIHNKLKNISQKLNRFLNYFISEILIFIDGVNLNFGCINHDIIRSKTNPFFDQFVRDHLIKEFYQCIT